ncbi:MAG: HAD-IC family P-type ATPase [Patescibacteria group bacterium]
MEERRYLAHATRSVEESLRMLGSAPEGLTVREAVGRLHSVGENRLTVRRITPGRVLARQFRSAYVGLLVVAGAIALGLGERLDAALIFSFVVLNATLGFFQEYRAERALELLRLLVPKKARVRRDGAEQLMDVVHLVPGDVVRLVAGDQVPADLRIISAEGLLVDESALSGESSPAAKDARALAAPPPTDLEARNVLFSGTAVVSGTAQGVVVATAGRTVVGELARTVAETPESSELARTLAGFGRFSMALTFVTLVVIFCVKYLLAPEAFDAGGYLIFSIALAVGVIPEALPLVVTVSLSAGAHRLARKKVVPRRLSAIEDLGSVQVLCTDKTGTITENAMTVSNVAGERSAVLAAALAAAPADAFAEHQPGNAFDRALAAAANTEARSLAGSYKKVQEIPFTPERRRNVMRLADPSGNERLVVRGAPEVVSPLCAAGLSAGPLADWVAERGREGKRVLAVAEKTVARGEETAAAEAGGFTLIGAVAFADPLKRDAAQTIARARAAGVQVKILTGDGPEVAGAVGVAVGLASRREDVVTGAAFSKLRSSEKHLIAHERHVFARVSPAQKFEIIAILKERQVVGFLGEGFNDAPGLKLAHVGLAVDKAADVAKDAADIILLNHSLSVIVDGIMEGRRTFSNTMKYVRNTLSANFGNFFAVALASLFVPFLPILPVQILLVNLLSDFPMISIATDRVEAADLRRPAVANVRDVVLFAIVLGLVSTVFDFIFFGWFVRFGERPLQTMWFMGSILTELVLFYSLRTARPFWKGGRPSSLVMVLTCAAAVVTVLLPFLTVARGVFHFVRPAPEWMGAVLAITAAYFVTTEIVKLAYEKLFGVRSGEHVHDTP